MLQRAPVVKDLHHLHVNRFQTLIYHKTQVPDAIIFCEFNPTLTKVGHLINTNKGYTDHIEMKAVKMCDVILFLRSENSPQIAL